jgi:hypothetical protein
MFTINTNKFDSFLKKSPRNRLIILSQEKPDELSFVDIGVVLSKAIEKQINHKQISMVASDKLETIMQNSVKTHPEIGKYTAISNLGILFEKALKFDFIHFLDSQSKNQTLFIYWEGELDKNQLYFLSKNKGIQFDITNISHITL